MTFGLLCQETAPATCLWVSKTGMGGWPAGSLAVDLSRPVRWCGRRQARDGTAGGQV